MEEREELRPIEAGLMTAATVIAFGALVVAFLGAPVLGAALRMHLGSDPASLPTLSADFALPLLRGDSLGIEPLRAPLWVTVFWSSLLAAPLGILAWALRAQGDARAALVRWGLGMALLVAGLALVAALLLVGLILPVAPVL